MFSAKQHKNELLKNLIAYFFLLHMPFTRNMHRYGEKTVKRRVSTLEKGEFTPKKGEATT